MLLASMCQLPLSAAAAQVQWASGKLTVSARGEALADVLRELQTHTQLQIQGTDLLTGPVTIDLHGVSLPEALRALLDGCSYMLVEGSSRGSDRKPTRVFVVGAGLASRGAASAMPLASTVPAGVRRTVSAGAPAERIDAIERLGQQGDEASLKLVRLALLDSNEAVRAVAREALQAHSGGSAPSDPPAAHLH